MENNSFITIVDDIIDLYAKVKNINCNKSFNKRLFWIR
jgi:hypothetical protein